MTEERLSFQAEVSRLLDIVAHSLYSEREVFLRELISNASDACDRLRYAAIEAPALTADDPAFKVVLTADTEAGTLTLTDNGIGMTRDELVENLGTIARSGTAAFINTLQDDAKKDVSQIGQFGVGFYSAFMVADQVSVLTRKAGSEEAFLWTSDGKGSFTIAPAEKASRGTVITLTLKDDAKEFAEETRLRTIVTKYSDHIAIPIVLEGKDDEPLNKASALWTRSKSEITDEQYKEFYHHVAHAFDDPWARVHWKAEGMIEYTGLLFVPGSRPFDLFDPDRKHRVKLYVKRVFITEGAEEMVPAWLRFLRGVIDSEDLPLNVSREMLQNNPVVTRIRAGLIKRVLGELDSKTSDPAGYEAFWESFGAVLKEGLYDFAAAEHKDTLLKLFRARSTGADNLIGLADYTSRMKEGQEAIYYATGDDPEAVAKSPQLEGFKAKGIEVLLLTDPIDEFWIPMVRDFDGKPFKSVTQGASDDLSKIKGEDATDDETKDDEADQPKENEVGSLIALIKTTLGDSVKDVRTTDRLTDSAVCLVADEGEMDMHLARLMRQHGRMDQEPPAILELNPRHALIRKASTLVAGGGAQQDLAELSWLLLDQARIVEGRPVTDPVAFGRRLTMLVEKGLAG